MSAWWNEVTVWQWVGLSGGMIMIRFLVESGLDWLNLRSLRRAPARAPAGMEGKVSAEVVRRGLAYHGVLLRISLWKRMWKTLLLTWLVFGGVLPWLDSWLRTKGVEGAHHFVAYFALLGMIWLLASLPWMWHHTFGVEQRFGFNRQSTGGWWMDIGKSLLVSGLFGLPLGYAAYGCLLYSGKWWWLWLSLLLSGWQLLVSWLFPMLVVPLFYQLRPLPKGELRSRLEVLAERARFAYRDVFVMDASRRSTHSNAFFAGLFQPRIVLFDTLVERISPQECEAVLAHEIGHYQSRHIPRQLLAATVSLTIALYILSLLIVAPQWANAFGFDRPSLAGETALALLLAGPLFFFMRPFSMRRSRRYEYQADAFAANLTDGSTALKSALLSLSEHNLSNFYPHPWFSAYHYSHPTLTERMRALDTIKPSLASS